MPLILKFDLDCQAPPKFLCTVHGYLNNEKPICVVTQHTRTGDMPLSSCDVHWASAVDQFTNDDGMEFGKTFNYEDFVWVEHIVNDRACEEFVLVTFDIIQPDRVTRFIQKLSNPKRLSISQQRLEEIIGEKWSPNSQPALKALEYWYGPNKPLEPTR